MGRNDAFNEGVGHDPLDLSIEMAKHHHARQYKVDPSAVTVHMVLSSRAEPEKGIPALFVPNDPNLPESEHPTHVVEMGHPEPSEPDGEKIVTYGLHAGQERPPEKVGWGSANGNMIAGPLAGPAS